MENIKEKTLLDGVEATTTSAGFNVEGMKRIGLQFLADITSGNGVFTVLGSIDGTNFVALSLLIDNTANTNGEQLTRVASKTLNSDTSVLVFLDNLVRLKAIKVKVTRTTDGTYSAFLIGGD